MYIDYEICPGCGDEKALYGECWRCGNQRPQFEVGEYGGQPVIWEGRNVVLYCSDVESPDLWQSIVRMVQEGRA